MPADADAPAAIAENLLRALQNLGGSCLAIVKTRFELLSTEIKEEWLRLARFALIALADTAVCRQLERTSQRPRMRVDGTVMKARDRAIALSVRRERLQRIESEQRLQLARRSTSVLRRASVMEARIAAVRNVASNPMEIGAVGVVLFLIGPRRTLRFYQARRAGLARRTELVAARVGDAQSTTLALKRFCSAANRR